MTIIPWLCYFFSIFSICLQNLFKVLQICANVYIFAIFAIILQCLQFFANFAIFGLLFLPGIEVLGAPGPAELQLLRLIPSIYFLNLFHAQPFPPRSLHPRIKKLSVGIIF